MSSVFAKAVFQMDDATVHSVSVTDEKIVFIVSGKCRFILSGSGWVNADLDHGVIVVLRPEGPGDAASVAERSRWQATLKQREEQCKRAKVLDGKKTPFQFNGYHYVIERDELIFVSTVGGF